MTVDLGTLLATFVPLICLGCVVALGRGGRKSAPLIVGSLVWGFVSTWVVVGFNDRWNAAFGLTSLIVLGAPIMEEVAKSVGTPLFAASRRCTWFVDGTIIGLASGTGFAIRENWVYLDRSADGLDVAIARVTSTNLMHAGCAAIVGGAVALSWTNPWMRRLPLVAGSLLCAMALHSVFNRFTQQQDPSALIITITGVGVFICASGIVALGLPLSQRWARADLAERGANRSEQLALSGGTHLASLLDEFEARYGAGAAAGAERLIELQRRLAIGRAGGRLDETELTNIERSADAERRALGLHAMMWLRSHLPVDPGSSGLLNRLELADCADPSCEPRRNMDGLWARLDALAEHSPNLPSGVLPHEEGEADAVFPV